MSRKSTSTPNPFYGLLVVVGVLFALTACAYFVMALRGANPGLDPPSHGLIRWLERYGLVLMLVELAVLGLATFGAMMTDEYWVRRAHREREEQSDESDTLRRG